MRSHADYEAEARRMTTVPRVTCVACTREVVPSNAEPVTRRLDGAYDWVCKRCWRDWGLYLYAKRVEPAE